MKNNFFTIFALICIFFSACGTNPPPPPPEPSISLNCSDLELWVGGVVTLEATVVNMPSNEPLEWSSTNPDVASVFYGKVTALAVGTTDIIAKVGKYSAVCKVNVDFLVLAEHKKSIKRGVGYNFQSIADLQLMAPGFSWYYAWGTTQSMASQAKTLGVQFYPMVWNGNGSWASQITNLKANDPDCDYILAYNEPNLSDQANMTPQQAAAKWTALYDLARQLNMKIVSPAMNHGTLAGWQDPIYWLDEFFKLVPLSQVDAIAVHSYLPSAASMKEFTQRFYKYGKPIWLTEFCAWDNNIGNAQAQMAYMSEALQWLEADPMIERYAWFIPRYKGDDTYPYMQLLKQSSAELTKCGKVFLGISSQDKTLWAKAGERIEAEKFTSSNVVDYIGTNSFGQLFHLQPTTDVDGNLELCDFFSNQWAEYQVDLEGGEYELLIRYAAYYNTTLEITIDGSNAFDVELPKTGEFNIWSTAKFSVNITAGKHTIRLKNKSISLSLNWLKFNKK